MVGTNDQFARIRQINSEFDEMTEYDWQIVGGKTRRLDIALDRPTLFRGGIPDQLRALATELENIAAHTDISLRSQLCDWAAAIRKTNWTLAELAGRRHGGMKRER